MGHSHAELSGVLLARLLRIVSSVEVFSVNGALGASHVTSDDEMGGSVVLPNDHVLDCLTRTRHLHAVRQVGPSEHWVLLLGLRLQCLIGLDSHQAVDVTRLGGATGGVHQQNGVLHVLLSTHQQLEVGTVDRVAILERDDLLVLRQCGTHLGRSLSGVSKLGQLEAVHPAADVVLSNLLHQRCHSRVLQAAGTVALLCFHHLVGLPDGRSLQDRNVRTLPLQQQLVSLLDAIDLREIESDRQAKKLLLGKAHVLHDGVVGCLLHEACEGTEGATEQAEDVARLALIQLNRLHCAGSEALDGSRVLDHQVDEGSTVRSASEGGTRVDTALRFRLAYETAGALGLVGLNGHGRVHIAERLEHIRDRGGWASLDLSLRASPERLPQVHLGPRKVREMAAGGLDRRVAAEGPVVASVHWHTLLVHIVDDVLPAEVRHRVQRALLLLPDIQGDALGGLVHAPTRDEDVLFALRQGTLEGLHLADEVEVGGIHLFAVAILSDKLLRRRHALRELPHGLLRILALHQASALQGAGEEVQGVNGHQVHAIQNLGEVLAHQSNKDVVSGQPSRCEHHLLAILGEVLVHMAAEVIHLQLQRGEVPGCPSREALRQLPCQNCCSSRAHGGHCD
mmetsp:Transcript_20888/g.49603  ORF Transcript_20888/g.49603 Transcript_20888/m.49603 type:complete len:623 (-) Transcript_20888:41-1909(-)